jgi:hypothetical protein
VDKQDRAGLSMNDSGTGEHIGTPLTQPRSADVPLYTYFITDGTLIKIGRSIQPRARIKTLSAGLDRHHKTLAIVPSEIAEERATHHRFHHLRERGEWFRPGEDLLEFIAQIREEFSRTRRRRWAQPIKPVRRERGPMDVIFEQLHSIRIRSPDKPEIRYRVTTVMGLLRTMQEPEAYSGHHEYCRATLKKTMTELENMRVATPSRCEVGR